MRVLLTGVCGFICSHFAKHVLAAQPDAHVIGFARKSDDRNLARLEGVLDDTRFQMVWGDLCDANALSGICEHVDVVVNFAAKTFVDHSLKDDRPFLQSNVVGAMNLMNDAMRYGVKRFVQVSTDEVYGQIITGAYKEDATLNPRNPYAWSKACADLYAVQLHRTHGFPVIITRTENNFGPWQHRQKVLPTFVRHALAGEPLPVYGDGLHVRCWLHVEEHCRAIWHLIQESQKWQIHRYTPDGGIAWIDKKETSDQEEEVHAWLKRRNPDGVNTEGNFVSKGPGFTGEVFHVAGEDELTNLDLAKLVLRTLGKPETQIRHIPDRDARPGHDRRYALDCAKLRATGFTIKQDLRARLAEAVLWYADHQEWTR